MEWGHEVSLYQNFFFLNLIYLLLNIGLIIYGIRLWKLEKNLRLFENIMVLIGLEVLAFLLIYFNFNSNITYFPMLFLLALIYSVAIENGKLFKGINVLCILIILAGNFIILKLIDTSFLILFSSIVLQCSIYFSIVFVIRNYMNECLTCELVKDSCPHQNTCVFYQTRWKNQA